MLMNDIVDWLIPDIPKDISQQIHREKILMVDLFMKEDQQKEDQRNLREAGGSAGIEMFRRSTHAYPFTTDTNSTKTFWHQ